VTLRLPLSWLRFLQRPVVDIIAPDDDPAPDWTRERRRLHALTEIHKCSADNVVFYDFVKPEKPR
jgi:hypothetical protein